MLVLTRKAGEGITIGPNIRLVVLDVKGGQVRLGIEAPPTIQVHRDEVYARILDENKQAASTRLIPLEALKRFDMRQVEVDAKTEGERRKVTPT